MKDMFDKLNVYRSKIKDVVLTNQDLMKLVYYNDTDEPLTKPEIENVTELINDCIYFRPIIYAEVISETKTFLLFTMKANPTYGKSDYVDIILTFKIITHNDLYELKNGDIRTWKIASEINKCLQGARGKWMGKCEFIDFSPLEINKDYDAMGLMYKVSDFKVGAL